jgi:ribosome-associated translation inhibitor RaiA
MQVLVSSDDPGCCGEELIQRIEGVLEGTLERFGDRVTRVEVRLGDRNSPNPGDRDKSCTLEAGVAGLGMVTASHEAATLTEAIHGAADKLKRAVSHEIKHRETDRKAADPESEGLIGGSECVEGPRIR